MTIDTSLLDDIAAKTKKKYGNTFYKASDHPEVTRIPFGSHELNIATGGGAPLGYITRFWGEESAGKSLNSLLLAKNAQKIHLIAQEWLEYDNPEVRRVAEDILERFPDGMKVCWYDAERSFDTEFARKLGVNVDDLLIFDDRRIEAIGETLEAALSAAHLHIIDSTSAGVSVDELKAKLTDWQVGLKARAWNKVVDRFQARIDKRYNAIVFVDQVRVDMKTNSLIVPGGRKLRHEAGVSIHLSRGKWQFRKPDGTWTEEMPRKSETITGSAEAEGFVIKAHVKKSRVGTPLRRADMIYDTRKTSYDLTHELAKAAEWLGTVELAGSWYELPNGEKVHGVNKLKEAIEDDPELRKAILQDIQSHIVENP